VLKTNGLFVIISSRSITKRLEFLSELKDRYQPFKKVATPYFYSVQYHKLNLFVCCQVKAISITGGFVHWRDGTKVAFFDRRHLFFLSTPLFLLLLL